MGLEGQLPLLLVGPDGAPDVNELTLILLPINVEGVEVLLKFQYFNDREREIVLALLEIEGKNFSLGLRSSLIVATFVTVQLNLYMLAVNETTNKLNHGLEVPLFDETAKII